MERGIWDGLISFGLINVPITIISAKEVHDLQFRMLDKRDHAPIGYKMINKQTGKEIDRTQIIKGYEYKPHQFVIMNADDFKKANVKATQTIDLEDFINLEDVDIVLFDTPYYLAPRKGGEKGYVLLRQVLEKSKKVAIAKVVLHNRQHLAAVMPRGDFLILELMRFAHEVKNDRKLELKTDFSKVKISQRELDMAEALVRDMTSTWKPQKYKDTYYDDLIKRIESKVKRGNVEATEKPETPHATPTGKLIDLMPLLKKSLESRHRKNTPSHRQSNTTKH